MSAFDEEIRVRRDDDGVWAGHVHAHYNIAGNPNGGYLAALAASALVAAVPQHPDPLSLTVHYLRPGLSDQPCRITTTVLRTGRTQTTARATLTQAGEPRLEVLAALGDLSTAAAVTPALEVASPSLPPPQACPIRDGGEQGVALPILDRVEIRLNPEEARAGAAGRARISGWVRMRDGRQPDALASLLFADAFPPAVFGWLGSVGWVPTVALTVQVRRRPAPGWMLGRFETIDLAEGRLIEDGMLWDAAGHLVVQSRQLALVRTASAG
jgi:acyl-CoA thioesterase